MNVVRENTEHQTALLKVLVTPADYGEAVDKALKTHKKKANIPGFRPGMVPMSIIHKLYKKSVTAQEAYKTASDACFEYVDQNKVDILGDVMPSDTQAELDFENDTDFEFVFEIGLAPDIALHLTKKDKITRYTIAVDDKAREAYKNNFLRRFGKLIDVEKVENEEALTVTLTQEDMTVEEAYVGLIGMSEEERKPFIGKKTGDVMQVNVNELYKTPSQRASVLGVKEAELEHINPEFTLTIDRIRTFEYPELNGEFFAEAYPDKKVTNAEEFNADIESKIAADLEKETGYKFIDDVRSYVMDKANISLPESFLKKWLYAINEGKFTMEAIEKDFDRFAEMMKWDLVKKYYVTANALEVSEEEAIQEAKALAAMQFAYYGMPAVGDDMLENYAGSMLKNKEEVRRIYERLYERKVVDVIAEQVTVSPKTVTSEEFQVFCRQ